MPRLGSLLTTFRSAEPLQRWTLGLITPLLLCQLAGKAADRARVTTVDGAVWEGEISWHENAITITPLDGPPARVELPALQQLALQDPGLQPNPSPGTGTGLLGFYYAGTNFQGTPTIRLDDSIRFSWGWNTMPLPAFRHDLFSIRWTGRLQPPRTDVYSVFLGSDDGGRFWLDGQGPFSMWRRQDYRETNCTLRLMAGQQYDLVVEYFDYFGTAQVELSWSASAFPKTTIAPDYLHAHSLLTGHLAQIQPGPGLLATYHLGSRFGAPSFSRIEPGIALDAAIQFAPAVEQARQQWAQSRRRAADNGFSSPADENVREAEEHFARLASQAGQEIVPGVSACFFTARWSGQVRPTASGVHTFRLLADEGVRLWLDDELVIDRWDEIFPGEYRHLVKLRAHHPLTLRMETRNTDGQAVAKLFWAPPEAEETPLSGALLSPTTPGGAPIPEPAPGPLQVGGVWLRNGTFVPIQPLRLDATALQLGGPVLRLDVPRPRVARIYFRPLGPDQLDRLNFGRTGALLENGDFVEGEVLTLNGTEVRVDSVLFGRRSYQAPSPVIALVLQEQKVRAAQYQMVIKDLGTLLAADVKLTPAGVLVPELMDYRFLPAEIVELNRLAPSP